MTQNSNTTEARDNSEEARFRRAMRTHYGDAVETRPEWVEDMITAEWEWVSQYEDLTLADKLCAVLNC